MDETVLNMSNTQSRNKNRMCCYTPHATNAAFKPFMLSHRNFQKEDYFHSNTKTYAKSLKSWHEPKQTR